MTHRCGAHVYSVYSGGLEDLTGGAHVCPGGPAMTLNRWSTSAPVVWKAYPVERTSCSGGPAVYH
eukprot:2334738-Prymnesium_polylepis.1